MLGFSYNSAVRQFVNFWSQPEMKIRERKKNLLNIIQNEVKLL